MAIKIPQDAVKTFEKVMGALGGEDYSYYLFDVKNVNEKPKAKKVVEMVVYVPQAKRVTAAANIQASLEGIWWWCCCNSNSRSSTMCICCYEILLW